MLDHVSIAVRDLDRAGPFYDAVLCALGYERRWMRDGRIRYGDRTLGEATALSVVAIGGATPAGGHLALRASDRAAVDAFHAAGLAHGGRDDGPPGPRPQYHEHYYGAFLLDPEGNRIEAVCHASPT